MLNKTTTGEITDATTIYSGQWGHGHPRPPLGGAIAKQPSWPSLNSIFCCPPIVRVRYYDPRYVTRAQGQMLIVPHARESDSGEYCCIATNGVGEPAKSCGALQLKMSMCAWLLWCHSWSRSRCLE